jgi:hypothetical protein
MLGGQDWWVYKLTLDGFLELKIVRSTELDELRKRADLQFGLQYYMVLLVLSPKGFRFMFPFSNLPSKSSESQRSTFLQL